MTVDELLSLDQFSVASDRKSGVILPLLRALTEHHAANCRAYGHVLDALWQSGRRAERLEDLPHLPVGLFKSLTLSSVPADDVFAVAHSSGTTGQQPSQVVLDRRTAALQARALSAVLREVVGRHRVPLLIVDAQSQLRASHARAIGIRGMLPFGRPSVFALDADFEPDPDVITDFLARYGRSPFLVFGFTFLVWRVVQALAPLGVDLANGTLIHSGGWKTLKDSGVSNQQFKDTCRTLVNLRRVFNFYGMVEQPGSVFLEGEDGFLYTPACADVIVRDPETWQPAPLNQPGVLQVLSVLPESYPGHSLLTEDLGVIHGIDDGPCGRRGKYFTILGRLPRAELRGCSDVAASRM